MQAKLSDSHAHNPYHRQCSGDTTYRITVQAAYAYAADELALQSEEGTFMQGRPFPSRHTQRRRCSSSLTSSSPRITLGATLVTSIKTSFSARSHHMATSLPWRPCLSYCQFLSEGCKRPKKYKREESTLLCFAADCCIHPALGRRASTRAI